MNFYGFYNDWAKEKLKFYFNYFDSLVHAEFDMTSIITITRNSIKESELPNG